MNKIIEKLNNAILILNELDKGMSSEVRKMIKEVKKLLEKSIEEAKHTEKVLEKDLENVEEVKKLIELLEKGYSNENNGGKDE